MTKRCPKCGQSYADQGLNFCLADGELLMYESEPHRDSPDEAPTRFADEPPPTIMMDPRRTDPIGWSAGTNPPAQWQQQGAMAQGQPMAPLHIQGYRPPDQTLAIIATILGGASLTIGWCCYSGLLLGPAAIICGFVALAQSKNNPTLYGGRGLSIAGIVMGSLVLIGYLLFIIIYVLAMIGGA